jgi:hypothetical protein
MNGVANLYRRVHSSGVVLTYYQPQMNVVHMLSITVLT